MCCPFNEPSFAAKLAISFLNSAFFATAMSFHFTKLSFKASAASLGDMLDLTTDCTASAKFCSKVLCVCNNISNENCSPFCILLSNSVADFICAANFSLGNLSNSAD